jgi:hypothetical protein
VTRVGVRCAHERRTYVTNQVGETIAWSCDQCPATGAASTPRRAARPTSNLPTTVPQLDECDWCGDPLPKRVARTAFARWLFKRYCGRACYTDDLEDRRETGRAITCPDSWGPRGSRSQTGRLGGGSR